MPELGPPPLRAVDGTAAEVRFYEAVCAFLLDRIAGARPGVLLVDDAHWADEASLRLLLFLAHRLAGRPLLVVVTWQPEAVSPEHPVSRLLAGARVLRLGRLTADDVLERAPPARISGSFQGAQEFPQVKRISAGGAIC